MNIVVTVKQIPDPAVPGELNPDHTLKREGKLILDESDSYGVEMALQLVDKAGGGDVILVSMAPNGEVSGLRTALAMGAAKAILVSDDALHGADALTTAKVLAKCVERAGDVDLVITATEATDGYTGTIPAQLGELLDWPSLTFTKEIEIADGKAKVQRQTEAGYDEVEAVAARGRERDRRCGRAPVPVVQGDHGGEEQAGRPGHDRRPRARRRRHRAAPEDRERRGRARPRGRREDRGRRRGVRRVVEFLDQLKVI